MGDSPQYNDKSLEIMLIKVVPKRNGLAFYQHYREGMTK
jgi:hypothetical protein